MLTRQRFIVVIIASILCIMFLATSSPALADNAYPDIIDVRRTLNGVTQTVQVYNRPNWDNRTIQFDYGTSVTIIVYVGYSAGGGPPFYYHVRNDQGWEDYLTSSEYYQDFYPWEPIEGDYMAFVDGSTPGEFYLRGVYPDLTASVPRPDDGESSPPFCVGDTVNWWVTITNNGDVEADSSDVGYYLGTSASDFSRRFDTDPTGTLAANGGYSIENAPYTFQSADVGDRVVNVWADYPDDLKEEDDNNNTNSFGPFEVKNTAANPSPTSPANGAEYCTGESVNFCWSSASGADSYEIQVSTSSSFSSLLLDTTTSDTCYTYTPITTGTLYWRVSAHNSCGWGSFFSPARSISVRSAPTSAPTLSSPSDGYETCDTTPEFAWETVNSADSYHIQVDNNSDFSSPEVDTSNVSSPFTPPSPLTSGTYYWRVRAVNSCNPGPWSVPARVITILGVPEAPTFVSPDDGYQTCNASLQLSWGSVSGATSYHLQVDDDSAFGSPEVDDPSASSPYTTPTLSPGTYYWRVRASNSCGPGSWSSPARAFSVGSSPTTSPTLTSPDDGYQTCNASLDLSWGSVSGATSYHLQVDDDSAFGSPEVDDPSASSPYTTPTLSPGTYYWRVRASNSCGPGSWSSPARTFTISSSPATPPNLTSPDDGYQTCNASLQLSWGSVSGATSYHLQVDDDSAFGSPEVDDSNASSPYTTPTLSPGTYYWRVRASNSCNAGPWSDPIREFAIGSDGLHADFIGRPLQGYAPLQVDFSDESIGSPTEWLWDFGHGDSSTEPGPSHVYPAGTFTVTLTVTDACGSDFETKPNYINVDDPHPAISDIKVTNVRDQSFTVSWTTDISTTGYVEYWDSSQAINMAEDKRGAMHADDTHYVVITGLSEGDTYFFDVVSGATRDDNGGAHYQTTTAPIVGPPIPYTVNGHVFKADTESFAEGTVVFITIRDSDSNGSAGQSAPLSVLVAPDGGWVSSLGNARTEGLSGYFYFSETDDLVLHAQGAADGEVCATIKVGDASPAPPMYLGSGGCSQIVIDHTPVTSAPQDTPVPITATISGGTSSIQATLFYTDTGGNSYTDIPMNNTSGDVYGATIPASAVTTTGVDYYISATDGETAVRDPAEGDVHHIDVSSPDAIVRIHGGAVAPGQNITVPVTAEMLGDALLGAATIEVEYDPAIVDAVACDSNPDDLLNNATCNKDYDNDGTNPDVVRFNVASIGGVSGNVPLADITFKAEGQPGDSSILDVQIVAFAGPSGNPLSASDEDGEVTIGQPGDVNCSGGVDVVDALFVLQYDVGLRQSSTVCPLPSDTLFVPQCDVNNSGTCDVVDALFILQCDVGISNDFCPASGTASTRVGQTLDPESLSGDSSASIGIASGDVAVGDSITLPITAGVSAGNLGAATVEIEYDPTVLDAVTCNTDPDGVFDAGFCNSDFDNDGVDPDVVRFNVASVAGLSGSISLSQVTFQAVGAVGDGTALDVQVKALTDPSGSAIDADTWNGKVCIVPTDAVLSDVQTAADRWRCRRGENCYAKEYDVDCDTDIDVVDIARLALILRVN